MEVHKYTVIEELEEIYPETGQKMVRPRISAPKVLLVLLAAVTVIGLAVWATVTYLPPIAGWGIGTAWKAVLFALLYTLAAVGIFIKQIIIFLIRVYQRFAPYEMRCRCVFIPNCSEYMILSIQKYGVIRGMKGGIRRLKRCLPENVGEDYP